MKVRDGLADPVVVRGERLEGALNKAHLYLGGLGISESMANDPAGVHRILGEILDQCTATTPLDEQPALVVFD